MTHNQIAYHDLEERKRSNRANERETNRSNLARESELNRHNTVTEQETERHNRATELGVMTQIDEQRRHSMVVERQNDRIQSEVERSNLAKEANAKEQISLGYANVGLGYGELSERTRSNLAQESLQLQNLNQSREIKMAELEHSENVLAEQQRASLQKERQAALDWANDSARVREQTQHNRTTENETERSNKANEFWKGVGTVSNVVRDLTNSLGNLKRIGGF